MKKFLHLAFLLLISISKGSSLDHRLARKLTFASSDCAPISRLPRPLQFGLIDNIRGGLKVCYRVGMIPIPGFSLMNTENTRNVWILTVEFVQASFGDRAKMTMWRVISDFLGARDQALAWPLLLVHLNIVAYAMAFWVCFRLCYQQRMCNLAMNSA